MEARLYIDLQKASQEYEYRPAGPKPKGPGWESTKTGGWKRPEGMGGVERASEPESEGKGSGKESEAPKTKDLPKTKSGDSANVFSPEDIKPEHREAAAEFAREELKDPKLAEILEGDKNSKADTKDKKQEEGELSPAHSQAKIDAHNANVSDLINNANSHLEAGDLTEEHQKKIESVLSSLEEVKNLEEAPSEEQAQRVEEAKKLLGEHAKALKEDKTAMDAGIRPQKTTSKFSTGRAKEIGAALEEGASDVEGGGAGLGSMAVSYGGEGVTSAGHHLLTQKEKEDEKDVRKRLYISDLNKAISSSSSSSAGPALSGERAKRKYEESFSRRTGGVSGNIHPTDDDPDVGKEWREGDEEDLEEEREEYSREQKEAGVIKSVDMLKSLSKSLSNVKKSYYPRSLEMEFLVNECGYTEEQVLSGKAIIKGIHKDQFTSWMGKRLRKSVDTLYRRIV